MEFTRAHTAVTVAAALALAGLAACDRHHDVPPTPSAASPSGNLVGTTPANPTGNTPETTPVASNTTDVSKTTEITKKPQEGDNHSYSTEAKTTPQKSDGTNHASSEGSK